MSKIDWEVRRAQFAAALSMIEQGSSAFTVDLAVSYAYPGGGGGFLMSNIIVDRLQVIRSEIADLAVKQGFTSLTFNIVPRDKVNRF